MPPLKVASFGKKGINVVDSPLHLSDDDLAEAQNAEIFFEDGYPSIRKRLGMTAGVTEAMDGPVFALTSIPLPDPIPSFSFLFAPLFATAENVQSDDGTSWATEAQPPFPYTAFAINIARTPSSNYGGRVFYFQVGTLMLTSWDGSNFTELVVLPIEFEQPIYVEAVSDTEIYFGGYTRVLGVPYGASCLWNGSAVSYLGTATQDSGAYHISARKVGDLLYVGTLNGVRVWNGSAWAQELTLPAGTDAYVNSLEVWNGQLYGTSFYQDSNFLPLTTWKVFRQESPGVWTDISPPGEDVSPGEFGYLAAGADALYVVRAHGVLEAVDPTERILRYDGAAWTVDYDPDPPPGEFNPSSLLDLLAFNGGLYCVALAAGFDAFILRRESAGVWTPTYDGPAVSYSLLKV